MQNLLLLNQYQNRNLLKELWQHLPAPQIHYLFSDTVLEQDNTKGPILVYGDIQPLLTQYQQNPTYWAGLHIQTSATVEDLLKHLRALLFITYPPESKGVLTYYDTRTLHYFFNYTEPEALSTYLGPIDHLTWYGNTWLEQNNLTWHELAHPTNTQQPMELKPYQPITNQQQQGLAIARQHKYIHDWSKKMATPIEQTNNYFQEAITLGFDRLDHLDQYMTLRADYPSKAFPDNLLGQAQQKLYYLENLWTEHREA